MTRAQFTPPVSILRSLKGLDSQMYEAFRSHCLLHYDEYEVLFGVDDRDEPALALVKKLQEEFPRRQLRVVYCPEALGLNGKVSNLAQMLPRARYEYIVINDSDIVVPSDYLRSVMAPLAQPDVGMVTALYRGIAGKTLGSRLEALGLSADFMGGVLVARALQGIRFALGGTIATTKTVLAAIGGLEPLAPVTSAMTLSLGREPPPQDIAWNWLTRLWKRRCPITVSATSGRTRRAGAHSRKGASWQNNSGADRELRV